MNTPTSFNQYLAQNYTKGTARRYARSVRMLLQAFGSQDAVEQASFRDITNYLHEMRKQKLSSEHIRTELSGIKALYTYLVLAGKRMDNPTLNLYIHNTKRKDIQFQNLFSRQELEQLLERESRYKLLRNRNKLILSLYIYQGLTTGEIQKLHLDDLDVDRATVLIKAGTNTNSRILPLESNQVLFLDRYVNKERSELVKLENYAGSQLFLGKLGSPITNDQIHYLVESQRFLFVQRKLNPKTIRQSVLVNLFKQGWDVKDVQLFAGHRFPSTTERYKPQDLSELKEAVEKWHVW
ncbi:MAG: tyrosine-type recombinase/integrase [Bacteroidia bacterium]|nr:tyrosine-type recombinase/integrase [Bacteroidia bacterium]